MNGKSASLAINIRQPEEVDVQMEKNKCNKFSVGIVASLSLGQDLARGREMQRCVSARTPLSDAIRVKRTWR